ncbi:MAG: hypothetical protein MH252_14020 [Thermosynechococcaceae cyanobacterium MS004]|nr:hypothetical protein [Thermosynechococcaceae cyanobacterium MS004]
MIENRCLSTLHSPPFLDALPIILSQAPKGHLPIAGAFALRIDAPQPALRWVEREVNWRSHVFQMPYGDHAQFLRISVFQEIGGFPALPIMEDFELVRRLKQRARVITHSACDFRF